MSTSIRNRLPGTIEKIVSDKVVLGSRDPNCSRNRDIDHHNWVREANESQRGRRRVCGNQGDRSVRRKGIALPSSEGSDDLPQGGEWRVCYDAP